jgi:NADPH2:quinone reductase
MRCWLVERVTDKCSVALTERPDPVPGQGELLVRVEGGGVNFADSLMVRGHYQRKPEPPVGAGIQVSCRAGGGGLRPRARAAHLRPLVGGRFALADAPATLAQLGARQIVGKILPTPHTYPS